MILVAVEEILFLRAELKYVTVRTAQHEYLVDESLVAMEKEFAFYFVRIHRNCLVAKNEIVGFEKITEQESGETHWTVKLKGLPEGLPISRRQQNIVREFG